MVVHHAVRLCICCITGPSNSSSDSSRRDPPRVSDQAIRNAVAQAPPDIRLGLGEDVRMILYIFFFLLLSARNKYAVFEYTHWNLRLLIPEA